MAFDPSSVINYEHSDTKPYLVTLEDKNDLEGFYSDMESNGYKLHMKRPMSRTTQYYMTSDQAVDLRKDPRVDAVEIHIDYDPIGVVEPFGYEQVNNTPYGFNGDFEKSNSAVSHGDNDRQWAQLHSSGSTAQRRKGVWGHDATANVNDDVEIFADGKHVDVVIVDQPVSYDCEEWKSPTTGKSRFVEYDWYGELNQYVGTIDDDGNTLPSGSYVYHPNSANATFHGTHCAGTVAGQWYGWAREANIYSLHVNLGSGFGNPLSSTLVFDYLRAFHRHKPINPATGKRNPTVTNHSWGSSYKIYSYYERALVPSDIDSIRVRGTVYNASNPGPNGWTMAGIEKDFGVGAYDFSYNKDNVGSRSDMVDAIKDGVVCIAAAGNNDQYSIKANSLTPEFADWSNYIYFKLPSGSYYLVYPHQGSSPGNTWNCITVGCTSHKSNFEKTDFSNFGPAIDVWAPGDMIQSAWPDPANIYASSGLNGQGYVDNKYGPPNWRYTISGTSMASPQVCGIAALLATGKERFTNSDVMGFIQHNSYENEMTFDVNGGFFDDRTCSGGLNPLFGGATSTNREIKAINPRNVSGLIDGWYKETLKGERRETYMFYGAQMFPRTNTFYRPIPPTVFPITVSVGSGIYLITGDDRSNSFNDTSNPTINVKKGDVIQFTVNAGGHPFWIGISQQTGQVTWNSDYGVIESNGAENGIITWNTSTALIGTYYYNCEYHGTMSGMIFVNA